MCGTSVCFLAYSYVFARMEEELPTYIFNGTLTLAGCLCTECPKLYWGAIEERIN